MSEIFGWDTESEFTDMLIRYLIITTKPEFYRNIASSSIQYLMVFVDIDYSLIVIR
ncbi:hypothetical protein [Lentimicrobium sp. S6]|uniref:hypothetical protein n=1 Tax=Lentimicrobium sp. S6 TaxID=2735872 RepID=UPI001552D2EF|nr:hypothetical protein [Lentimicrobium sp. S6]NPD45793.1 hypothetical protein [Lentimicrobium sp. S6]